MSQITFDEARTIVLARYYTEWEDIVTEPAVAEVGYENSDEWLMIVGAREFIVGGDPNYRILDDAAYIVNKRTGQLEITPMYLMSKDRYDSFVKYGTFPIWLQ